MTRSRKTKVKKTVSPYMTVRTSSIHSKGVFSKKFIPKGMRIIEYVGERVTKTVADKRADIPLNRFRGDKACGAVYIFVLNKRHDIDGYVSYNTARFINHSCDPNSEAEIIRGKIWIVALRDILRGEELTYNYGYDFDNYDEHECACQADNCVGFILAEEHWPKLKKSRKKNKAFTR